MTKQERQNKRCFACGKLESEHPGGQFCSTAYKQAVATMICCLFVETTDAETMLFNLRCETSVVGVYDATDVARKAGMKSTLEDIECEVENK